MTPGTAEATRAPAGLPRRGERPFAKLKPGPGHTREEVRAHQRARLHVAVIELVAEHGFGGVTVRSLTRTSGVSTRALYGQFANVEECLASAYRAIMRHTSTQLTEATALSGEDWEAGLRSWVGTMLAAVAENPAAAHLALVDAYDGGPAMLREISNSAAPVERALSASPHRLPLLLSKGVAAGIERVVRSRLIDRRQGDLPQLADELTDWILGVYAQRDQVRPGGHPSCRPAPIDDLRRRDAAEPLRVIGGDRGRILAGVVRLAAADGYWSLTAPRIRRKAGVSRRRFDSLFASVTDCYLEAAEVLMTAAAAEAELRARSRRGWQAHIEDLASRFVAEVVTNPTLARVGFLGILAPGAAGLRSRENLTSEAARWLCAEVLPREGLSPLAAEAATAASWQVMQAELEITGCRAAPELWGSIPRLIAAAWPIEAAVGR